MANKNKNILYMGIAAIGIGMLYAMGKKKTDTSVPQTQAGTTTTAPNTTTSTSAVLDYNLNLKVGSKGAEVKLLQQWLKVTADGIFGNGTQTALANAIGKTETSLNGYLAIIQNATKAASTTAQKNAVMNKYPFGKTLIAATTFRAYYVKYRNGMWLDTDEYGNSLGSVEIKKGASIGYVNSWFDFSTNPILIVTVPSYLKTSAGNNNIKIKASWAM